VLIEAEVGISETTFDKKKETIKNKFPLPLGEGKGKKGD